MTMRDFRYLSLATFSAFCVLTGVEFYLWLRQYEEGIPAVLPRPPAVDAFLPISSLMNFVHTLESGSSHAYHPAGLAIFLSIALVSLFLAKSFCGWICPFGFLSELVWKMRSRLFGTRNYLPGNIPDKVLRSIKYLILAFFLWAIFITMDRSARKDFLDSPYNLIADAKMYDLFANLSITTAIVTVVIFVFSLFIRNAWCRYLCPYGALLAIVGLFAPWRIHRNEKHCISCDQCARACPNSIPVDRVESVRSDECFSCFACMDACPTAEALKVHPHFLQIKLPSLTKWRYLPAISIVIFLLCLLTAIVMQQWHNRIPESVYREHLRNRNHYGHPGRASP